MVDPCRALFSDDAFEWRFNRELPTVAAMPVTRVSGLRQDERKVARVKPTKTLRMDICEQG